MKGLEGGSRRGIGRGSEVSRGRVAHCGLHDKLSVVVAAQTERRESVSASAGDSER